MFRLTFVTPEKRFVIDQEIDEVTIPGHSGELHVLPGHAPLITTLETGILKWKLKSESTGKIAVISWGYCEIHPEGVDILADIADLPEDIDVEECNDYLVKAEKRLATEHLDDEHWQSVQREVSRMRADLQIAPKGN